MWKLRKKKEPISFYGEIISARPCIEQQQRIGYRILIRTTIEVEHTGHMLPVYVSYLDKSPNRQLYEWWKRVDGLYGDWRRSVTQWQKDHEHLLDDVIKYQQAYEKWIEDTQIQPLLSPHAPVFITGKKRGQRIYRNVKMQHVEPSDHIIWIFLYNKTVVHMLPAIPSNQKEIHIYTNRPHPIVTI